MGGIMTQISISDPDRWTYFSDRVMGGVSVGGVHFSQSGGVAMMRLTGTVSTANRGGFIQVRTRLDAPLPASIRGVRIAARGNGQTYFIHLRTADSALPWQYYQAPFDVTDIWQVIDIPLAAFRAAGQMPQTAPTPGALRSLAVAAFGRDHAADLSVRAVGFYQARGQGATG